MKLRALAFLAVAFATSPAWSAVTNAPADDAQPAHKKKHHTHTASETSVSKAPATGKATKTAKTTPPIAAPTRAPPVPPAPPAAAIIPPPSTPAEPPKGMSGLLLPRYAALRSDDVNFRAGPGTRYPIDWIYKRRDLPVEIEREFEVWRLVRDPDGTKGWVHQATLTGRRSAIVTGADRTLRASADDAGGSIAVLRVGVIVHIRRCDAGAAWCEVQAGDYRGWLRRDQVWGVQPDEAIG